MKIKRDKTICAAIREHWAEFKKLQRRRRIWIVFFITMFLGFLASPPILYAVADYLDQLHWTAEPSIWIIALIAVTTAAGIFLPLLLVCHFRVLRKTNQEMQLNYAASHYECHYRRKTGY